MRFALKYPLECYFIFVNFVSQNLLSSDLSIISPDSCWIFPLTNNWINIRGMRLMRFFLKFHLKHITFPQILSIIHPVVHRSFQKMIFKTSFAQCWNWYRYTHGIKSFSIYVGSELDTPLKAAKPIQKILDKWFSNSATYKNIRPSCFPHPYDLRQLWNFRKIYFF